MEHSSPASNAGARINVEASPKPAACLPFEDGNPRASGNLAALPFPFFALGPDSGREAGADLLRPLLKLCLTAPLSSSERRFSEPPNRVIKSPPELCSALGRPAELRQEARPGRSPTSLLCPGRCPGGLQAAPVESEAELAVMKLQTHPTGGSFEPRLWEEKSNYLLFREHGVATSLRTEAPIAAPREASVPLWREWPRVKPAGRRPLTLGPGIRARVGQLCRTRAIVPGAALSFEKLSLGFRETKQARDFAEIAF